MEYFREAENRIQAGFALRSGKLLAQYIQGRDELKPEECYDATLTVCVLQALLTTCSELRKTMDKHRKRDFRTVLGDTSDRWGLCRKFISADTFPQAEAPKAGRVLDHLRNALSHPRVVVAEDYPSTGFTTVPDGSDAISMYRFTDSPWVDKGKLFRKACSDDRAKVDALLEQFQGAYGSRDLEVRPVDGVFRIYRGDGKYVPVFVLELPLEAMTGLALKLSNYLAQPANDEWDGRGIVQLVA
jgi:hypothetical protein